MYLKKEFCFLYYFYNISSKAYNTDYRYDVKYELEYRMNCFRFQTRFCVNKEYIELELNILNCRVYKLNHIDLLNCKNTRDINFFVCNQRVDKKMVNQSLEVRSLAVKL